MIKSKTELALQELHQEIHMIVKKDSQNDTSYFPDAQKVLESFENYLQCSGIDMKAKQSKNCLVSHFYVFQENISSLVLLKYQRSLNLIIEWDFFFKDLFKQIFSNSNQLKKGIHILHQVNVTEIIFLMYLCLEVERKEIIGKVKSQESKNMFLLKQIIKILNDFYTNGNNKGHTQRQANKNCTFSINQDKFVKILLLKALKIKLQKQNFSFGPSSKSKNLPQKQRFKSNNLNLKNFPEKQSQNYTAVDNLSLISVQSEYNVSNVSNVNEEMKSKMKSSFANLPSKLYESKYQLEMKNLSNEDVFQYISLNELKGYIKE